MALLNLRNIHLENGDNCLFDSIDLQIDAGERLCLVGRNGTGKSTLMKLLCGEVIPDDGEVLHSPDVKIARLQQDVPHGMEASVFEVVAQGLTDLHPEDEWQVQWKVDTVLSRLDFVEINGQKRHIISYLQDFLFTPLQIQKPVKVLSGGERNRLLLARLFAQPSNLLVLDEPTNDLDAETLELLEELLIDYQGTLLLISHDRSFLNSVVTRSIVFERSVDGKNTIGEYAGGYDDWLLQRPVLPTEKATLKSPKAAEKPPIPAKPVNKPKKLSFKDQRELDLLPACLEQLEAIIAAIQDEMSKPAFYQQSSTAITAKQDELAAREAELEQAFARWEELEQLAAST